MKSPVEGYEGLYEVSQSGAVYSINSDIYLSQHNHGGYLRVSLWKNNKIKTLGVHRLVAGAFIPNPDNKPQVNHKDGNPLNNHVSNLEWVTVGENLKHSYRVLGRKNYFYGKSGAKSHLSKPVVQLSAGNKLVERFVSATDASKAVGVSRRSIGLLCKGSVGGFRWMFEEDYKNLNAHGYEDTKGEAYMKYDRPKTRGELRDKLKDGVSCEVAWQAGETTKTMLALLDMWVGKDFATSESENKGWVLFTALPVSDTTKEGE